MTGGGRVIRGVLLGLLVLGICSCGQDAPRPDAPGAEGPAETTGRPAIEFEPHVDAVASGYGIETYRFQVTLPETCGVKARLDLWKRGAGEAVVLSEAQSSVRPGGLVTFALPPDRLTAARNLLGSLGETAMRDATLGEPYAYLVVDDPDGTSRGERLVFSEPVNVGFTGADDLRLPSLPSSGSRAQDGPIEMHTDIPVYGNAWGPVEDCSIVWYEGGGRRDETAVYAQRGPAVEMTFRQTSCDYVLVLVLRFWPMGEDPGQTETED